MQTSTINRIKRRLCDDYNFLFRIQVKPGGFIIFSKVIFVREKPTEIVGRFIDISTYGGLNTIQLIQLSSGNFYSCAYEKFTRKYQKDVDEGFYFHFSLEYWRRKQFRTAIESAFVALMFENWYPKFHTVVPSHWAN